jgi:ABC-type antimicrobial peptide transport system permease subunit
VVRRRRQIGIMKAIGGTRGQIASFYLAQSVALGVAAIALGLVGGFAGNRVLTDYLARLLNFDVTSYAIPAPIYLLVAVVGLLAPLLATVWPIARATAMPVREALDSGAAGGAVLRGARVTEPATRASGRLAMAVRSSVTDLTRKALRHASGRAVTRGAVLGIQNVFRRPGRAVVSLTTLTLAGAAFMTAINVRTAMMQAIDALFGNGTFGSADRYAFDQHMLMIYDFLLIAAAVLAVIGSLALMTVTSLNVLDRRRELGVLRTIGATPGAVMGLVIAEAGFVAAAASALAIVGAWPLSALLGRFLTAILFRRGLGVTVSVPGVVTWLLIAATVSVAASIVPAWHVARRSIREAVSYD